MFWGSEMALDAFGNSWDRLLLLPKLGTGDPFADRCVALEAICRAVAFDTRKNYACFIGELFCESRRLAPELLADRGHLWSNFIR